MGIPRNVYGSLIVLVDPARLTELELEKLRGNGLDISPEDLTILPDGTLAYKNSRVLLYIRDVTVYENQEVQPRFHLANCQTLKKMRRNNRFGRYVVSINTNGRFDLNILKFNKTTKKTYDLSVCQNCLSHLGFDGFNMASSKEIRLKHVINFSIDRFFDKYPRSLHSETPNYNSDNALLNKYTEDFNALSKTVRSSAGWRCQCCGIDLSAPEDRKYLHVHHKNGLKHDNIKDNLEAICISCHAEKPEHQHMKNTQNYAEFLTRNPHSS